MADGAGPAVASPAAPARAALDGRHLTVVGGAMLAAAAVLPSIPGHPGLACPLRTLTGVPCPFCGLTTSVEATAHLHLGDALAASPAGIALVVLAVYLLVRRPAAVPTPPVAVTVAGVAAMWVFQLLRVGIL